MADPGIDALLRLLYATLDATPGVRQQGEAGLAAAACQPGFGLALAHVAVAQDLPYGIRQLAAVVLKQYVKARWRRPFSGLARFGCAASGCAAARPHAARERVALGRIALSSAGARRRQLCSVVRFVRSS